MDELANATEGGRSGWRTLLRFALASAAAITAYYLALHLYDLNGLPSSVGYILLFAGPVLICIALMWLFGFWQSGTPWRWRIWALGVSALVVLLLHTIHVMLMLKYCFLTSPSCSFF